MTWCLTTGPNLPATIADRLRSENLPHVTVVSQLDGLAAHLAKARISISQCGYNTAMDALGAHHAGQCRAVFVPYDTEGQSEQLRRAELLQKAGYAVCLPQSMLTVAALLEATDQAAALPQVARAINFNGVENTARLVRGWLEAR